MTETLEPNKLLILIPSIVACFSSNVNQNQVDHDKYSLYLSVDKNNHSISGIGLCLAGPELGHNFSIFYFVKYLFLESYQCQTKAELVACLLCEQGQNWRSIYYNHFFCIVKKKWPF